MSASRGSWAALGVFGLSGAAGLGYQAVWARQFAAGLGHEAASVLAVITAVMAGMGAGAWSLDRRISVSPAPGRWYAVLEWLLGGWGLLLAFLLPTLNTVLVRWIGLDTSPVRQAVFSFLVPGLVLLPATAAMGATLPAMERFVSQTLLAGPSVGAVYSANTLGAVAGVVMATWWLVPAVGLKATALILAGLNLACGIALAIWSRTAQGEGRSANDQRRTSNDEPRTTSSERQPSAGNPRAPTSALRAPTADLLLATSEPARDRCRWVACAVAMGFLGIAYEVLGIRVLSQVLENTVYTYASVLAVFLTGTALGAAAHQRWGLAWQRTGLLGWYLAGLALACALGRLALPATSRIHGAALTWAGSAPAGLALAEGVTAASVFLLPTLIMGAAFSHVAQTLRSASGGVGLAAGGSTLGGASAPFVAGVAGLSLCGAGGSLVGVGLGYAGLSLLPVGDSKRVRWARAAGGAMGVLAVAASVDVRLLDVPSGAVVRQYREGVMGNVAVVEEVDGSRILRVDNRFQMGGTAAVEPQSRQAHLPLLLHPAPRRALFLGTGTGITLGAATVHPGLVIDGVELVPDVVRLMGEFEPANRASARHRGVRLHVADARRFILAGEAPYDVVVADLFHPARDGAGLLFTREHFAAVRRRLAPDGLFCQWLPLHQLEEESLRIIVRTFVEVFPQADLWLLWMNVDAPVVGLVGYAGASPPPGPPPLPRLTQGPVGEELRRLGLADPIRFQGHRIGGAALLQHVARQAPVATDDRPRVVYTAPRLREQPGARPYDRLLLLLAEAARLAAPVTEPNADATLGSRLERFREARDLYLRGLVEAAEQHETEAVTAFLKSAGRSLDFTAGYAQCLSRIALLRQTDPPAARRLAQRLVEAQPGNPVGHQLLERWNEGTR